MDVTFDCPYCDHSITCDTSTVPNGRIDCAGCHEIVLVPAAGIGPGMKLGDFRIEGCLGVGGMGEVFLAVQEAMDRQVALKVLPPAVTGNKALVSRFMQEARMSGKLEHPNIVTAFYAGQDQGYYYLAMSYVDGEDLEARIKRDGRIPEREALEICLRVARALDYAWEKHQLLHRDIKPANIMITHIGDEVKLMDMGIAKALDEDSNLTMAGVMIGTPFYMSPEQAKNVDRLDCRTDIYALGGTLFHMVTGARPYDGPTAISVVAKHLNDPVPSPHAICPQISLPTSRLITKMMAKDAARRPQHWRAMADELEEILGSQHPHTLELKMTDSQQQLLVRSGSSAAMAPDATIGLGAPLELDMDEAALLAATLESTEVGLAPAPRTAREYVDTLPPNPTLPRSLKLAFGAILLLLVALLSLWAVRLGYDYSQTRKQHRLQEEQAAHERKLDEAATVTDVEAEIAARQKRAELQTQAELRRRELTEMLRQARNYRRENPEDVQGAMDRFQKVREYAAGTAIEMEVDDELQKLSRPLDAHRQRMQALTGRWEVASMEGDPDAGTRPTAMQSLRFNPDRTFTIITRSGVRINGTFLMTRDHLTLDSGDTVMGPWRYELQAQALTLHPREGLVVNLRRP